MNYKAVLFDLDGTLLDTVDDLADSMNFALERLGLDTHPVEAYKIFVGDGVEMLVRRVATAAESDGKLAVDILDAFCEEYDKRWHSKTTLYDGIDQMLDSLVELGITMTVLSNKPHDFTELCVSRLLPQWRFEIVRGVSDQTPAKPNPAGALSLAKELDIEPDRFLYLGDTNTDMKTATAVGMFAVGAEWGFRSAEELNANGAKVIINHPTEFLKLL